MKHTQAPMASKILGGASIAVALYAVLAGGMPNFSNTTAERMLSELATHLSTEANHRGKEAKLQYSNVEIHGIAYDKWAHITHPSLDIIHQQWQGGKRFGISTEGAELFPDQTSQQRLNIRLPQVVNLIVSSELLAATA